QLLALFMSVARQQHPDILHRRTHAAVIEIDHEQGVVAGAEDVTDMAVAMGAEVAHIWHIIEQLPAQGDDLADGVLVTRDQFGGDEALLQELCTGFYRETLDADCRSMPEIVIFGDAVQTPQELTHSEQVIEI